MRINVNGFFKNDVSFVKLDMVHLDTERFFHVEGIVGGKVINLQFFTHESDYAPNKANDVYLSYVEAMKKEKEITIVQDYTKTTPFGGMLATDGEYDYSYDRCRSSIAKMEKHTGISKAYISHKDKAWHSLTQDDLKALVADFDKMAKNASDGWGKITARFY